MVCRKPWAVQYQLTLKFHTFVTSSICFSVPEKYNDALKIEINFEINTVSFSLWEAYTWHYLFVDFMIMCKIKSLDNSDVKGKNHSFISLLLISSLYVNDFSSNSSFPTHYLQEAVLPWVSPTAQSQEWLITYPVSTWPFHFYLLHSSNILFWAHFSWNTKFKYQICFSYLREEETLSVF